MKAEHREQVQPRTAPNVNHLVIMSDEYMAGALSCAGRPVARTPNLDRLAERHGGERGLLDRMRLYFDYTPLSPEVAGRERARDR